MDLSKDYLLIDDPITVAYQSKTAQGTWATAVNVPYVQRASISKADLPPALLEKDVVAFHCWTIPLAGIVPKIGDKLNDGKTWAVMMVEELDRDSGGIQRYKLICIRSQT